MRYHPVCVLPCLLGLLLMVPVGSPAAEPAPPAKTAENLRLGQLTVDKVLFLGNSITLHGAAPDIGWLGEWGMAASAADKDYVHLLSARIANAAGGQPQIKVRNAADFERQFATYDIAAGLKDELAFAPNLVVVALGENVPSLDSEAAQAGFKAAFAKLLAELKQHGQPTLIVRGTFWDDARKNQIMRDVCQDAGGTFVSLSGADQKPANFARAERQIAHGGVAGHPGDQGMQVIADAIWAEIEKVSAAKP